MTVEELQAELTQLVASGKLRSDSQVFVYNHRDSEVPVLELQIDKMFGIPSVTIQY